MSALVSNCVLSNMATSELDDKEFGSIQIHRVRGRRTASLRITPGGKVRITVPQMTPLFIAKRLLESSRVSIRKLLVENISIIYRDGMQVGKSHVVRVVGGNRLKVERIDRTIRAIVPHTMNIEDGHVQSVIREMAVKVLRREAKHYLSKRLRYLADKHDFSYTKVQFSHASSRWGSCSSNGTISLNIALMNVPFELIDYVILHELCHTQAMNHSQVFWQKMSVVCPNFELHRKNLKKFTPIC